MVSRLVTYFNYLLFGLQLLFVRLENSPEFPEKFFLSCELLVEVSEIVPAVVIVVILYKVIFGAQ